MNQQKDLFSIGAFANLTRLSIKALRLYDQLDILQPHHIDPQSGYRFYGIDQLLSARMIRVLREMDMPLAAIRQVLASLAAHSPSTAEAETLVQAYVEMRERQVGQIRQQVNHFVQLLQQEKNPMNFDVNVRRIAPQRVLSITYHVKVDKLNVALHEALDILFGMVGEQNEEPAGDPFGIYHGAINEQDDGPVEVCLPVNEAVKPKGGVQVKQLKGGNAACTLMTGTQCDFPVILGGYDAAADWIQKNGYKMAESPREVWYHEQGPDAKMEVVWLFK